MVAGTMIPTLASPQERCVAARQHHFQLAGQTERTPVK